MDLDLEREKDAVDFVTNSMFALDFLRSISDVIFSEDRDRLTVGQFYDRWLKATSVPEHKIPFNLGAFLGYLYCGLLLTKELWYVLVPDQPVSTLDPEWSLSEMRVSAPQQASPTARYVVRRLRNALGHGNIAFNIPEDLNNKSDLMNRVTVRFHDENPRDPSDILDAEATLTTLAKLIRRFQGEIHRHVREKKSPPLPN